MANNQNDEDIAISALRDAVFAIEKELGITPSGVYSDTRARLDILEARINNPSSPTSLSDGYVNSPLYITNSSIYPFTISISDGYGVPTENRTEGSIYIDYNTAGKLYVNRNAAWVEILTATSSFTAGGDLSGTATSQTVIGLQNRSVNSIMPNDGYVLTYDTLDGYWVPRPTNKRHNITMITGTYSVLTTDEYIIVSANASPFTITLPAIPVIGDIYQIKDKSGNSFINNITVSGNGNNIDGFPTYLMNVDYGSAEFIFDGMNWNVF